MLLIQSHDWMAWVGAFVLSVYGGSATVFWRRSRRRLDVLFALSMMALAVFLAWTPLRQTAVDTSAASIQVQLWYQLTLLAALLFFLEVVNQLHMLTVWVSFIQWLGGSLIIVLRAAMWPDGALFDSLQVWQWWNALFCGGYCVALATLGLRGDHPQGAALLILSLAGFGLFMVDMHHSIELVPMVTAFHFFYACAMGVLWLVASGRLRALRRQELRLRESVLHEERQRISRELHDGVGSQLVHLLAGLDRRDVHQQELALALEQCLLDLKLMVDEVGDRGGTATLVDLLASLRYRVQPVLSRLGVLLQWEVDLAPQLDDVRGERARQVLRIVQEGLANAIRHAGAQRMGLSCRYDALADRVTLELWDNGRGLEASSSSSAASGGKGMASMRHRAQGIGARLDVSADAVPGTAGGTRLRLELPRVQADASQPPTPVPAAGASTAADTVGNLTDRSRTDP